SHAAKIQNTSINSTSIDRYLESWGVTLTSPDVLNVIFQLPLAFPEYCKLACCAVHNRRCYIPSVSSIDNDIYFVFKLLMDKFGVCRVFQNIVIVSDRS